jgi:hypothetical protein
MQIVKRVLAVIVMVVSVLVLVLSLSGIAGAWIIRAQFGADLLTIVTAAETRAATAQQGLDRLDAAFTQARDQITTVEQDVQAFGADLEQNRPLLTAIADRLGLDLTPLVDSARQTVTTMREAVAAVNSAVEAFNAIPFVSVPVPELETLAKLSQDVENLITEIRAARAAIDQRRSEIIQGSVSIVTTPTSQIGSALDEMSAAVAGYSQELGAVQQGLADFKSAIDKVLLWGAVILTLILLWIAFSQVWLLGVGWRALSGQAPLPREEQETSSSLDLDTKQYQA